MKNSLLFFMMCSGVAFNAMADLNDTQTGGAFTVLGPKVSNSQKVEGCPTIETPLLLNFEHNFRTDFTYMYNRPDQYYNPWKANIGSAASEKELIDLEHEVHVYIELFELPNGKFASNDMFSYYDAANNIIVTNGKNVTKWHKISDKKYKLIIPLSSDFSALKQVYALSRNFKTLEMFHFQSHSPEWEFRNDYAESKKMVTRMHSSIPNSTLDSLNQKVDTYTKSLYLYQMLSRSSAKDTNVNFEQKRGFLYQRSWTPVTSQPIYSSIYKLSGILLGGRDFDEYLAKFPFEDAFHHRYAQYALSDKDSFKNYLKLESFDFKLMNSHMLGTDLGVGYMSHARLSMAQYNSSDFKMTKENAQICGLD